MSNDATNSKLTIARINKNDEFYTRFEDIEPELVHYIPYFLDKTVLLNCDNYQKSQFVKYFTDNFSRFGLKKLIATSIKSDVEGSGCVYMLSRSGDSIETSVRPLNGDGDFRCSEIVENYLSQSDIVVGNPPFSLFREYVSQLIEHEKRFLIIGNLNITTKKNIFPLFMDGRLRYGTRRVRWFVTESGEERDVSGIWFTNMNPSFIRKRKQFSRKYYDPHDRAYTKNGRIVDGYDRYDNYDAINVNKTENIPIDYMGVMGVPITALEFGIDEDYEIIGVSDNGFVPDEYKLPFVSTTGEPYIDGKKIYTRVFIKRRT